VDYVTGKDISFSIFYLAPVSLVAWKAGLWPSMIVSLLSGVGWYLADKYGGHDIPTLVLVWNAVMRVLVVEDYKVNQMVIARFLKDIAFQVDTADNGRIGLDRVKTGQYQLVLMDVQMPEMDGLTATRLIREWERAEGRAPVPVVALTASALREDRELCQQAGCTAFVAKPVRKAELLAEVARVLRLKGESREGPRPSALAPPLKVDPELEPLMGVFRAEMREKLAALQAAGEARDCGAVKALGHQVKGAGGSYGFDRISELGEQLERASGAQDRDAVTRLVGESALCLNGLDMTYEQRGN
jgi:CheY-like chemotaxis protein/HPt (histidine-containing phosphotransfer) domain-containing protein